MYPKLGNREAVGASGSHVPDQFLMPGPARRWTHVDRVQLYPGMGFVAARFQRQPDYEFRSSTLRREYGKHDQRFR